MNPFIMYTLAFFLGGNIYCTIELIYRSRTHYSMFFCAGIAIIVLLNVFINSNLSPFTFAFIAMITITALEFIFGIIFNLWLNMNVWDYSNTPFNLFGQICLPFSFIWYFFGIIIYYAFKLILKNYI